MAERDIEKALSSTRSRSHEATESGIGRSPEAERKVARRKSTMAMEVNKEKQSKVVEPQVW